MIDEITKQKFIEELGKVGIISSAAGAAKLPRSTVYRLIKDDKAFGKEVRAALKRGREGMWDMAEFSLVQLVRDRYFPAVVFVLKQSPKYKPKKEKIVIEHVSGTKTPPAPEITFEDILDEQKRRNAEICKQERERLEKTGPIPFKSDGTEITDEELAQYTGYIMEYQRRKRLEDKDNQ